MLYQNWPKRKTKITPKRKSNQESLHFLLTPTFNSQKKFHNFILIWEDGKPVKVNTSYQKFSQGARHGTLVLQLKSRAARCLLPLSSQQTQTPASNLHPGSHLSPPASPWLSERSSLPVTSHFPPKKREMSIKTHPSFL